MTEKTVISNKFNKSVLCNNSKQTNKNSKQAKPHLNILKG